LWATCKLLALEKPYGYLVVAAFLKNKNLYTPWKAHASSNSFWFSNKRWRNDKKNGASVLEKVSSYTKLPSVAAFPFAETLARNEECGCTQHENGFSRSALAENAFFPANWFFHSAHAPSSRAKRKKNILLLLDATIEFLNFPAAQFANKFMRNKLR